MEERRGNIIRNVDPISHIINEPNPDEFCVFRPDYSIDVSTFGVTQHKDWHRLYMIDPYDATNWIGNGSPYGLTDYEEWDSYRDSLYDAVDVFLGDCDELMGTQPFAKFDERYIWEQFVYNKRILLEYLRYMEEEMHKCRDACEPGTNIYNDYEELYDWATTTQQLINEKRLYVKSGTVRIKYDFLF